MLRITVRVLAGIQVVLEMLFLLKCVYLNKYYNHLISQFLKYTNVSVKKNILCHAAWT